MGLDNFKILLLMEIITVSVICYDIKSNSYNVNSGKKTNQAGDIMDTITADTQLKCIVACATEPLCAGANYYTNDQSCELLYRSSPLVSASGVNFFLNEKECLEGYTSVLDSCYKVVREPYLRSAAEGFCQYEKGQLVNLETENEYEAVKNFVLQENAVPPCHSQLMWVTQRSSSMKESYCPEQYQYNGTLPECYAEICQRNNELDTEMSKAVINFQAQVERCDVQECLGDMYIDASNQTYEISQFIGGKYWTGGKEIGGEGQWQWSNGGNVTWGQNYLNDTDSGSQDCMYMLTSMPGIKLNDEKCSYKYHFICEKEKNSM